MIKRISILLLAALLLWLGLPALPVQAHADLVRSDPAQGAALTAFPTSITMEFREAVTPETASAVLLDANAKQVARGEITPGPAGAETLVVRLPAQPDGVYTLAWQVSSADDGHLTSGALAFSVGPNTPRASVLPAPGTPDPSAALPSPWEVALRWLGYVSAALAVGAALFGLAVWRPAYRGEEDLNAWDTRLGALLRRFIIIGSTGGGVSAVGLLAWEVIRIQNAASAPFLTNLTEAAGHHGGGLFWVTVFALALMGGFASLLPDPGGASSARRWAEMTAFGAALLFSYSMSGHNAATGQVFPVVVDFLHLAGMSAWVGGLLPLAVLLSWQRRAADEAAAPLLARAAGRFSNLALASVIVLAASGIYSAWLQVRTLPALTGTRYGQAILAKVALFLVLIALGALNQRGILPRLASSGLGALRALGRSVRAEYVLAVTLLLAVGALMSLNPGYQALQADARLGYHQTYTESGVTVDFRVAPVKVGENEFAVDVVDTRPGAEKVPAQVTLNFLEPFHDAGVVSAQAAPAKDGRYTARGSYLSFMGMWEVEVVVHKDGFHDIAPEFRIDLAKWVERGE